MKRLEYTLAISRAKRCLVIVGSLAFLGMLTPMTSFAASAAIVAQQAKVKVKGTILDQTKAPVIGASVAIKGTTTGTMTDVDGKFTLDVPAGSNLTISAIGYKPAVVKVTKADVINVVLENDNVSLEQVVVVGFGTQKKENLTGAVTSVDAKKALDGKPITNLSKGLQGVAPGVNISYNNGRLGASADINIRGIGTIQNGETKGSPLVLVDGVQSSLDLINPEDVASISVLKDAASASIYGSRAAFGVILITTKTGKTADKVQFSYSGNVAFNKPCNLVGFVDPEVEIPVLINARQNAGEANPETFGMNYEKLLEGIKRWKKNYADNRTSNEMVYGEDWELIANDPKRPNEQTAYFYRVWDPHKEMLKSVSPQTTHSFQVIGKVGENTGYIASVGYVYEQGLLKKNTETNQKYTVNLGFNTQLAKWLKADFKVYSVDTKLEEPYNYYNGGVNGNWYGSGNGYFGYYLRWGKYFPYGTYKGTYFRHAPGFLANANQNVAQSNNIRLSGALEAQITQDIVWKNEYSVSTSNYLNRYNGGTVKLWNFWGSFNPADVEGNLPSSVIAPEAGDDKVADRRLTTKRHMFNSYATYSKRLKEVHNFKATVGANVEWYDNDQVYAEIKGLMDRNMPQFGLAYGKTPAVSGIYNPSMYSTAIAGYFARLNYDYKGKYLLELNGRVDGSSSFPGSNLWGFFPSASLGYRISQEPFMEPVRKVLNDAKLRLSYGTIGNQDVALYSFLPVLNTYTANWVDGSNKVLAADQPKVVDNDLTWERVATFDAGGDFRLFNMIGVTFDWFQRDTKGMFAAEKVLPGVFGTTTPLSNSGNLRTRGYDISVDFNTRVNDQVTVYANVSLSDSKTTVTKWNNPSKALGQFYSGMEIGEIWGLETDRLFQVNDFNIDANGKLTLKDNIPNQNGLLGVGNFKYGPGDVKYKDLNGDGKVDGGKRLVDDHGDLKVIGNTTPRYLYGIRLGSNFYGFDAEVFFQGVGKRDLWAHSDLVLPFLQSTDALYDNQLDYWTPENTNAYYPRPYAGHPGNAIGGGVLGSNNYVQQSRYLLDMSYFRLKNVTLGYTLPVRLTQKINIDKVRLYVSGQNLGEIKDKHLPVDPEINDTEAKWGRTYPYSRTYSFGLQVNF